MRVALAALLALAAPVGDTPEGRRPVGPVVEEQPLEDVSFALIHTNDTRGYLEACG